MLRVVRLDIGTVGAEDYFTTFQDISELARNLGVAHEYVSVSCGVVGEEGELKNLHHDENTLVKVHEAIVKEGLNEQSATEIITTLQNAGILFRERRKSEGE